MNCPYDPTHQNSTRPTEHGHRYYAKCNICGRKARAVVYDTVTGKQLYELVRIGKRSLGQHKKKVRTVRLSDDEVEAVERGYLRLVIIDKRITVTA